MQIFHQKRGFTLIELLVVVAIIGVLASIVLINLNVARDKARDAAIKLALSEVRTAAAIYYHGSLSYDGVCHINDGTLADTDDFGRIEANVMTNNGNLPVACYDSANQYCAQSPLPTGGFWCVDYQGLSGSDNTECGVDGNIKCD